MIALRQEYESAIGALIEQAKKVSELGVKLEAEVAAKTEEVAELDAKVDQLHRVELELNRQRDQADAVRQTLQDLQSKLAALKQSIPA